MNAPTNSPHEAPAMRMPRFRFTVKRMMVAVAIVGAMLALVVAITRTSRDPTNASEALSHAIRGVRSWPSRSSLPLEDYDAEVKRWRPDRPAGGGQYGVIFQVHFTKRDGQGSPIDRRTVWIMQ